MLLRVLCFKVLLTGDGWDCFDPGCALSVFRWVLGPDKAQLQEGFQICYSCCVEELEG